LPSAFLSKSPPSAFLPLINSDSASLVCTNASDSSNVVFSNELARAVEPG
jgi:hypothetical protein